MRRNEHMHAQRSSQVTCMAMSSNRVESKLRLCDVQNVTRWLDDGEKKPALRDGADADEASRAIAGGRNTAKAIDGLEKKKENASL